MPEQYIELCSNYTITGYPTFKPKCLLSYKAGLWCHKYDAPHYCNKYEVKECQNNQSSRDLNP